MTASNPLTASGAGQTAAAAAGEVRVTIRFAGDSGDGMQLAGSQFTGTTALAGNDLATLPDFPAEIRAPAGTLAGVSGFQIQFGSLEIFTPGDRPDALVAMNPAALQKNLVDMAPGSLIIVNSDAFAARACEKVGFQGNPLEGDALDAYRVVQVPLTTLTRNALEDTGLSTRDRDRSKNLVALGLTYWMYGRDPQHTLDWLKTKFGKRPEVLDANIKALKAGYHYGDTVGLQAEKMEIPASNHAVSGTYRNITGNQALAYGLIAASKQSGLDLFLGSYPITPASDILHELSKHKDFGVKTFQAEDEIAAMASAVGAAFGGVLAVTTTSGPGVALKGEAIGLAIMIELPVIIVNVQRGGPSTGLPTKTEQSDLMQALHGRNGEAPMPIVAPCAPGDCFDAAFEAGRLALKYMCPVMVLSDGYLANGAEPWKLPDVDALPDLRPTFRTDPENFLGYERDPETLARPWVRPGTPGLEHRVGGLEKADLTGHVSYDAANHEKMCRLRQAKIDNIANDIPDAEIFGDDSGDCLIIGWGGTFGALRAATIQLRQRGRKVSHMHVRHLNPLPKNVEGALKRFGTVVCAELNLGQLKRVLRERFLVDVQGMNKLQGQPFRVSDVVERVETGLEAMGEKA